MSNKVYDFLKWIVMVVMPALGTAVGSIGLAVGWGHAELFVLILTAVTAFLGACLGVSNHNYKGGGTDG